MKSVRRLGLAVMSVVALAVLPAMASASGGIVSDRYGTILNASQIESFVASVGGSGSSNCYFGETLEGEITGPSATYALSGTGAECKNAYKSGLVEMNDCKFEFDPGTQSLAIGPPTCSSIKTSVGFCKVDILPQAGLTAAQTNQEGPESDTVRINFEASADYEVKKEELGCMKKGVFKNLTLTGEFELTGYRSAEGMGSAVDIEVIQNGPLPVGVFMSEGLTKFEAQAYPVSYRATPVSAGKLKLITPGAAGTVTCTEGAAAKQAAPASALKFTEFSGCTFGGQPATVVSNSCSYEFTTQVAISCTKEGDKIQIVTSVCTITIAAQSFSGSSFTPKNAGEGYDSTVSLNSTASGITTGKEKTKESQTGCLLFPTGKIGTFSANVNLSGAYAG